MIVVLYSLAVSFFVPSTFILNTLVLHFPWVVNRFCRLDISGLSEMFIWNNSIRPKLSDLPWILLIKVCMFGDLILKHTLKVSVALLKILSPVPVELLIMLGSANTREMENKVFHFLLEKIGKQLGFNPLHWLQCLQMLWSQFLWRV